VFVVARDDADPTGLDSARLRPGLEGGRRRACLADVLRPRDVKWLPAPIGVGDVADISCIELFVYAPLIAEWKLLFCFLPAGDARCLTVLCCPRPTPRVSSNKIDAFPRCEKKKIAKTGNAECPQFDG